MRIHYFGNVVKIGVLCKLDANALQTLCKCNASVMSSAEQVKYVQVFEKLSH